MNKSTIIERLISQGHIVIACADRILNKKDQYVMDIDDLLRDGPINVKEAVILLKEEIATDPWDERLTYAPNPYFTDPTWTSPPSQPMTPWCTTSTNTPTEK